MNNYPGRPPPEWFGILFVFSAICGGIYLLFTDFWWGVWTVLFMSMGLWGDAIKYVKSLRQKHSKE
ncbi:hypothetical protein [Limnohabitans parvus]|uniref:hypothetical protein n=1 Tax=Limnohabitans parvus TaxID=540061 RepID=UPI0011B27F3E|nr:hypothetical protein [Limnohabitans parvus]